jgi:DnaJ-class molecular chaperone
MTPSPDSPRCLKCNGEGIMDSDGGEVECDECDGAGTFHHQVVLPPPKPKESE